MDVSFSGDATEIVCALPVGITPHRKILLRACPINFWAPLAGPSGVCTLSLGLFVYVLHPFMIYRNGHPSMATGHTYGLFKFIAMISYSELSHTCFLACFVCICESLLPRIKGQLSNRTLTFLHVGYRESGRKFATSSTIYHMTTCSRPQGRAQDNVHPIVWPQCESMARRAPS